MGVKRASVVGIFVKVKKKKKINAAHRTRAILPDSTPTNTPTNENSSNLGGAEQVEGAQPKDESYAIPGIPRLSGDQEAKKDAVRRATRLSSLIALKDLYREMIEAAALLEELKDFDATPLQDDLKGSFEYSDGGGGTAEANLNKRKSG